MGFLDDLYNNHNNDVEGQLSAELGISREKAATVLPQVAPVILAQLKRRAQERGADVVERQVEEAQGGLDADDIAAIMQRGRQQAQGHGEPGGGQGGGSLQDLLGTLLGGAHGKQASQQLSNQLGISPGMAAKIIPMVAPLILNALLKSRGQASAGQPHQGGGGAGGVLASILDKNGDGNILDDLLAGGAGSILGGGGAGAQGAGKGGCLSMLLGGLLGGGKR